MNGLSKKILDALRMYKTESNKKVLKTSEEVEANTSDKYLVAAPVVSELINKLEQQPEWIKDQSTGKITGYKFGGADTVFPFSDHNYLVKDGNMVNSPIIISALLSNLAYSSTYKALTLQSTTGSDIYGGISGTLTLELDVTNVNKIYYNVVSRSHYITPSIDGTRTMGNMIDVSNLVGVHTFVFNCGNQSKLAGFLPNDWYSIGIYDVYYK